MTTPTVDDRDSSPYVGPRPFSAADRRVFFGRDGEIAQLVSLVIAHRHLLLYAVSGAGKTSLLRAGLMPALREEGFEVLPPLRLQAPIPPAGVRNVFTHAALSRLVNDPNAPRPAAGRTLDPSAKLEDFFDALARGRDRYGFASPRLLVLDQFEELFTLYPDHWKQREEFMQEIADACERDHEMRVVFSLREEYAAQFERYARVLPEGLRARFHLDRLRSDAALLAVTGPLAIRDVGFAPGVAEQLIANLQETRVDLGAGEAVAVEGEFVEPVHLQVVCRSLWERLQPGAREVTADDLAALGNVDESLARYYDEAVAAAAGRARVSEPTLRAALERSFITSVGTRATVFAGADETAHLPAAALEELAGRHVIRAEWRAGGRWLELAHDRLIGPIRSSNARVRERARRRRWRRTGAVIALLVAAIFAGLLLTVLDLSEDSQRASSGPARTPRVATPKLVGLASVFVAQRRLKASELDLGKVTDRVEPGVEPGTIVGQSPHAGSRVVKGTAVDVQQAVGEGEVVVPSVVGLTSAAAVSALENSGLTVGEVSPRSAGDDAPVVSQSPAAGRSVGEGSAVALILADTSPAVASDLAVETLGIDLIGDNVVVTVAVRNLAGEPARGTQVEASGRGLPVVRRNVRPLPVGKEQVLQIPLPLPPDVKGPLVVTVEVDPEHTTDDRDPSNNVDVTAPLQISQEAGEPG